MSVTEQKSERLGDGLGDNNGLSWTIGYGGVVGKQEPMVSPADKSILRELANKVAAVAASPNEEQKKKLWTDHYSLKETRPLIFCDPETAWYEIFPARTLKCKGKLARVWEFRLLKEIYWAQQIKDDRVICETFTVQYVFDETSRGLDSQLVGGENGGAFTWTTPLKDYADADKLVPKQVRVDYQKTNQIVSLAQEVFGDILKVKLEGCWWWSLGMTTDMILLRGLEQMLMDMYDNTEKLHQVMAFLRDENLAKLDFLQSNGLLSLNNGGDFTGTGGYGWTTELPKPGFDPNKVRTQDMWGFCESQETIGVSPQLFEEFVFQYQLPMHERFGLNIYGCCEPLESRWHIIKRIPRLRKVTVSPWSDVNVMAENLGRDYVYCRKINPSYMSTPVLDEEMARKEIAKTFLATKANGCPTEILLRDVVTLSGNPENAIRWTQIVKEESAKIYKC